MNKAQHQQRFDEHLHELVSFVSDIFSFYEVGISRSTAVANMKQINIFWSEKSS